MNKSKTMNNNNNLKHFEKMELLRKYDPITYSEMTSDPTGQFETPTSFFPYAILILGIIGFAFFIYNVFIQ